MKQTAVEWLEKRFYFTKGQLIDIDFEQAKEMENIQLQKAIEYGYQLRNNNKPINSGIDWVKEFKNQKN